MDWHSRARRVGFLGRLPALQKVNGEWPRDVVAFFNSVKHAEELAKIEAARVFAAEEAERRRISEAERDLEPEEYYRVLVRRGVPAIRAMDMAMQRRNEILARLKELEAIRAKALYDAQLEKLVEYAISPWHLDD